MAIYIYNRFHYSQSPYHLSVIVLSYSFYNLALYGFYKYRSFSWCFFTHLLKLFESILCGIFSICLQIVIGFLLSGFFSSPTFSFIQILPVLSPFIIKAYSMGPFLCHTTNILNCCFYCIVQWYKPPFLRFSNSLISHRHMKYLWNPSLTDLFFSVLLKTLSRQVFFSGFPLDWYYNSTGFFICQHYFSFLFILIYFDLLF